MRFKTPFLLAFLAAFIVLGSLPLILSSNAASSTPVHGDWVNSVQTFNTYGQFSVNETLVQTTNSTGSLSSFSLGFPSAFQGHITDISLHGTTGNSNVQVGETTSIVNNTVSMTVSISPALPAGTKSLVSVGFYVLNTFQSVADGNYSAPVLFTPGVNIPLDYVQSSIVLPYLTTHIVDPTPMQNAGFSHTVGTNATLETWNYTGTNFSSSVRSGDVLVYSNPDSSGAMDFTQLTRQLSVTANGQVLVTDTLNFKNLGENTIYSLTYSPLTNASSLTALPNTEPPISNLASIPISGNVLDLNATGQMIQPDRLSVPRIPVSFRSTVLELLWRNLLRFNSHDSANRRYRRCLPNYVLQRSRCSSFREPDFADWIQYDSHTRVCRFIVSVGDRVRLWKCSSNRRNTIYRGFCRCNCFPAQAGIRRGFRKYI